MQNNKGIFSAAGSYFIWGLFPLYFHLLLQVPATQIVAHRIAWSFVVLAILMTLRREWNGLRSALNRKRLLVYFLAGVLLSINWLTYVWAVNSGFVVEASLGYFINPLVSVLLGVVFLHERLRAWQWVPVGLAAVGVGYLTLVHGSLPWIALVLALSFGLYGLIKKIAPLGSLYGLTTETMVIFLPAFGFLLFEELNHSGSFGHLDGLSNLFMIFAGPVTVVPLLLFSIGARSIPLTMLGLLQYITPTLQFLIGLFVFDEPFTTQRLVGFAIIWLALLIFSAEGLLNRSQTSAPSVEAASLE